MKFFIIFLAFSNAMDVLAIDKISGPIKHESCAIRLSNQPIKSNIPDSGTEFCSGSVIEDGSMIVFAAHCLNQILEKQSDTLGDNSFEIGYSEKEVSEKIQLKAGQYSLFSGDLLGTVSSREDFLESGSSKYIKDDLAIIKLNKPISNMKNCPVIPNHSECDDFEKNVLTFGKGVGLKVDFFISNELLQSGSMARKVSAWYPSKILMEAQATDVQFSPSSSDVKNLHAPIKVSFAISDKVVRMRKGDSGSLAYWTHDSKNIFVGIQSATFSDSPEKAYFSQVCKHVGTKKFNEFLKNFNSSEVSQQEQKKVIEVIR